MPTAVRNRGARRADSVLEMLKQPNRTVRDHSDERNAGKRPRLSCSLSRVRTDVAGRRELLHILTHPSRFSYFLFHQMRHGYVPSDALQ